MDVVVSAVRRSQRNRILIVLLSASVLLSALLFISASAQSACRDPDVARGFGSAAYAANVDATIQYFGHSFFLITTSKGTRIVTDPLGPGWYPNPNVVGDVVTVGKEMFNHNAVQIVLGLIAGPRIQLETGGLRLVRGLGALVGIVTRNAAERPVAGRTPPVAVGGIVAIE